MSSHYELSGRIRLRNTAEVADLLEAIRARCPYGFAVERVDGGPEDAAEIEVSIDGDGQFAAGEVLDFDEAVEALGPHAVSAAVFEFVYDGDLHGILAVGPGAEAAESRYVLERRIEPDLPHLTDEDLEKLAGLVADRLRARCVYTEAHGVGKVIA